MTLKVTANPPNRLGGLRRFAIAISVFNILGHTVFGFEQAWIQPLVSSSPLMPVRFGLKLWIAISTLANRGSQAAGATKWTFFCRRISPALPAPCSSIPIAPDADCVCLRRSHLLQGAVARSGAK